MQDLPYKEFGAKNRCKKAFVNAASGENELDPNQWRALKTLQTGIAIAPMLLI